MVAFIRNLNDHAARTFTLEDFTATEGVMMAAYGACLGEGQESVNYFQFYSCTCDMSCARHDECGDYIECEDCPSCNCGSFRHSYLFLAKDLDALGVKFRHHFNK